MLPWDTAKMNAVLADMRADEVPDMLKYLPLFVRNGTMSEDEAAEWKLRILAWQQFHEREAGSRH